MFAFKNLSKMLILALSLSLFVSISTANETIEDEKYTFPMIMWSRDSKVPTKEVDDSITA